MIFDRPVANSGPKRQTIQGAYLADETQCVDSLLKQCDLTSEQQAQIHSRASHLVNYVREKSSSLGGLNAFLQEYDLSSQEGVVLLCLAEALLRIPDTSTANQLIRDKLVNANWQQHLGSSQSLFVNASTWGLMLTGRIINLKDAATLDLTGVVNNMVSRVSEPVVRAALKEAMRIMGHQFVMGQTIQDALARSAGKEFERYRFSYDMLGEAAISQADADKYFDVYMHAIEQLAHRVVPSESIYQAPGISIKLSALHPRFEFAQATRVWDELIPKVKQLAEAASQANITMTIDGEEADRLELTLDIMESILSDKAYQHWTGLGIVVQAYQKRAPAVIDWLAEILQHTNRYITVRLVKGAYWDTEIKRAQEQGLPGYPVFTVKKHTDVSYLSCARKLIALEERVYPQFATHNAHTAAAIMQMSQHTAFELQRLHGMGEALYTELLHMHPDLQCRIYAPVGSHKDLLPYLVRRLLENGANTSFVNRITDEELPIEDIIADPIERVRQSDKLPHPDIPLPEAIFKPQRKNSQGCNLNDETALRQLQHAMQPFSKASWCAMPIVQGVALAASHKLGSSDIDLNKHTKRSLYNPANAQQKIGVVLEAQADTAHQALTLAHAFASTWRQVDVEQRAGFLENAAALFEKNKAEFIALLVLEGGRCIPDAISEVRETVDFCRYYAVLACKLFAEPQSLPGPTGELNTLSLQGRGVFLCISPWNFPLAIFCGQVAAALVAGNCVIAKPASQTPLIAYRAIQLLHEAGVPHACLHFLPASGALIANHLLSDQRVAGVAFTGSTETATTINRQLAQRGGAIVPLIAETGGQNAMIVDSSALAEQVVLDVIKSAFNSAGQRCSALRVLFLQHEIADRVITLLKGAMTELKVADPRFLSTDVGPVIDAEAQQKLEQHIRKLTQQGRLIYRVPSATCLQNGHFVGPCAFEIDHLSELKSEVFGPALHVIRYAADALDTILNDINNSHYGLTLGIHSRIQEKAASIQRAVQVGNIYVNRNMIGAAVGVQPFGGQGLSGTGPKAGGPHYLYRFSTEQVVTINTAAIGGNTSLLAL